MRGSEARLSLAAESAEAGLWVLDLGDGRFWTTEKARELFRFPPDFEITFEAFLQSELEQAYVEIGQLKQRLQEENLYLREEATSGRAQGEIIGQSEAIRRVLKPAA